MPSYTGTSGNDSVNITGQLDYYATSGNDILNLIPDFDVSFDYRPLNANMVVSLSTITGMNVVKGGLGTDTIALLGQPTEQSWAVIKTGAGDDQFTVEGDIALAVSGGGGNNTYNVISGPDDPQLRVEYHRGATGAITYTSNNGMNISGTVTGADLGTDTLNNVSSIRGTDFADTFNGGDGNEVFLPRGGDDIINGGNGFDTVRYNRSGVTSGVNVDLDAGTATGEFNNIAFSQTLSNIEYIRGSAHNDTIGGSVNADVLEGNDGDDYITGLGGNDIIDGGDGNDTLSGGLGDDQIWDGDGNDTVYSGSGSDQITNGAGDDITYLQGGGDIYYRAGEGQDQIIIQSTGFYQLDYDGYTSSLTFAIQDLTTTITYTNNGFVADQVAGIDKIDYANDDGDINYRGTNYNDVYNITLGEHAYTTIYHSGGNDIINNQGMAFVRADYRLSIDDQNSNGITYQSNNGSGVSGTVNTGKGDSDTLINVGELRGTNATDTFNGGDGNERFITEGGNDVINGGGGYDTLRYDRNGMDAVTVDLQAGTASGSFNGVAFNQSVSGIEEVRGSKYSDDNLSGTDGNETFKGNGGNDTLTGLGGDDYLYGGDGDDVINGGAGDDEMNGGAGNDTIYVGNGDDYVRGSTGNDTYHLTRSPVNQSDDYAYIDYEDLAAPISVTISHDAQTGHSVIIDKGVNGQDTFSGFDTYYDGFAVEGTNGNDSFVANGNDGQYLSFRGGLGDDTIVSNGFAEVRADFRSASNGIVYTGSAATQNPNSPFWSLMNGTVTGQGTDTLTQVDRIRGSEFDDVFVGGDSNDHFEGLAGNDSFDGGSGNEIDIVRYSNGQNADIVADLQAGTITGTFRDVGFSHTVTNIEAVIGSRNADELRGDAKDNIFAGNAGDDIIEGRGGNDRVYGDDGQDTAVFSAAASEIHRYGDAVFVNGPDGRDALMNVETLSFGLDGSVETSQLQSRNPWDYLASNMNLVNNVGLSEEFIVEHMFDEGWAQGLELDSFDEYAYFISNMDLNGAFNGDVSQAAEHYVRYGHSEGRQITFDGLEYIATNTDLIGVFGLNGEAGSSHYLQYGMQEGRKNDFDGLEYLASNADLVPVFGLDGKAATQHFIQYGHSEGRQVTFDGLEYLASHSDLIGAFGTDGEAATRHFIQHGSAEGRQVTFDGLEYIASNADLIPIFGLNAEQGALHYLNHGRHEGRNADFSGLEYLASHSDLATVFGLNSQAATEHFIQYGHGEGRQVTFDGYEYLASNTDLLTHFGADRDAGTQHYIEYGRNEGRAAEFDGLAYLASNLDLADIFGVNEAAGVAHFVDYGFGEGRGVDFDARLYLGAYADLRTQYGTDTEAATLHYLQEGRNDGYEGDAFSALEYIASYGDLIGAFGTDSAAAMEHYLNYGFGEGRGDTFDPEAYLNASGNGDLAAAFGTNYDAATQHYIEYGFGEGRLVS